MMLQIAKLTLVGIFSLWAAFYVGSLTPQLWRQKNYRGAIGAAVLAGMTMVVPVLFTLLNEY
ncbi:hypothetical protein PVOR_19609 [Paenibacillus vortex V453]|jgi:hypothetical protein|uniref:Uncharacterized protein n=2 Tax=Paenibacillus TaxID=44249 RepID=A0A163M3F7_9BACL|nr:MULTISPECIES: hypothetical protein [Paenibacillus]ANA82646.1 hypothetical protein A3958_22905 [Paenibacillus glucanolyticus]AVV58613.1 hypothetical protein C7121_22075 [Paenibacillus glucanolyticus]AWP27801.1 hypothetical protein B9D94_14755 [Paenibacillus sp. Cedars]EFU40340.1 hypothetical protein PVOR_19609 [Paenibacillus vortex V453]ETT39736.1 hypothetical protein C169_09168 [Paenibacillus sp. FSL R5-808]